MCLIKQRITNKGGYQPLFRRYRYQSRVNSYHENNGGQKPLHNNPLRRLIKQLIRLRTSNLYLKVMEI